MFHSAVLKLTGWYLLLLMSISLLFSFAIYHGTAGEIDERLTQLQSRIEQPGLSQAIDPNHRLFSAYRNNQSTVADHNILTMLAYVNLLILLGGGVLSYLLARRTLHQLEQAHEAQSRFASDASHELRTPLTAMKSELEVALRDTKLSKSDMQDLLQSNLEEVNKLTALSQMLLQLSRLDHANLEMKAVDIGNLASEVVQRYDKNASRIKLSLTREPLIVKANSASIEELFTILVDNALKYSPPASGITASLKKDGRMATFTITNKGKGIPNDQLPRVFERFYRINESHSDGGAGLGLSLAKEIVALHKGELSVSSKPNANTTFQFSLQLMRKSQA